MSKPKFTIDDSRFTSRDSRFTIDVSRLEINLAKLERTEAERTDENYYFKEHLDRLDGNHVDKLVNTLNEEIAPKIDCTACGNCCKSLMVNITQPEVERLSVFLEMDVDSLKEKYVETSQQGDMMVLNTIPCHFLKGTSCSIYEHRFTECRDFPALHRGNFKERLFSTFMHYGRCPIIYNVVEELKTQTGFRKG